MIARAASSMQCATLRFLHLRFPGLFKAAKTYMAANATTATTRPVLWNPAEKLGISHGRSSKDGTTIIACYRRFCGPSRSAFSSPWRGLLSRTVRPVRPEDRAEALPVLGGKRAVAEVGSTGGT